MLLQSGLLKRFTITKNYSDNLPMILGDNDCIKCATCVVACPKEAINFEKELKKMA